MHSFLHRFAKQSVSLSTVLLINIFLGLELANYICMGLLWLMPTRAEFGPSQG